MRKPTRIYFLTGESNENKNISATLKVAEETFAYKKEDLFWTLQRNR